MLTTMETMVMIYVYNGRNVFGFKYVLMASCFPRYWGGGRVQTFRYSPMGCLLAVVCHVQVPTAVSLNPKIASVLYISYADMSRLVLRNILCSGN